MCCYVVEKKVRTAIKKVRLSRPHLVKCYFMENRDTFSYFKIGYGLIYYLQVNTLIEIYLEMMGF